MQHDCGRAIGLRTGCTFSSDLGQLDTAHAVLFSAQMFPGSAPRTAPLRFARRLLAPTRACLACSRA